MCERAHKLNEKMNKRKNEIMNYINVMKVESLRMDFFHRQLGVQMY